MVSVDMEEYELIKKEQREIVKLADYIWHNIIKPMQIPNEAKVKAFEILFRCHLNKQK